MTWQPLDDPYSEKPFKMDRPFADISAKSPFAFALSHSGQKEFGRRTLEVAISRAIGDPLDLSAAREDWQRVISLADSAGAHMDALIKALAPMEINLRRLTAGNRVEGQAAEQALAANSQAAQRHADVFRLAQTALTEVLTNARAKDTAIAAANKNQGSRDQNEFVATFVEAWVSITGQLPDADASGGTFQSILHKAWLDAGQPEKKKPRPFRNSIKLARERLSDDITALSSEGPEWFDRHIHQ